MKFAHLQLRTSLSLMVLLLSILTLAAVGLGWNSLRVARDDMAVLADGGLEAGRAVRNAYQQSRYMQPDQAAQQLDAAFKQFDGFLRGRYADVSATAARRYQFALYVFVGLAALALLLALMACLTLSRTVLRPLREAGSLFDRMAAGDLTEQIEIRAQNEIGMLYAAMRRMQDSLSRVVAAVRQGMEQISVGSQRLVAGNADLSGRTGEQATALQQTAASMEQLASTVRQNADNARQANQLAASASEVAQRGGRAVGEVVATMEKISDSSRKIADIVGVIDSIAFQTNILALNAAVEAARAGEQGKGFAVVASEVRALAQRSAQAAKEIKTLIEDSVSKIAAGSSQVGQAGATMEEIVNSVARVTDIMGEISAATTEQSAGIEQINRAVTQMDDATQQNAALVQEASALAAGLREDVAHVLQAVSTLKTPEGRIIDVAAQALPAGAAPRAVHGRPSPPAVAARPPAAAPANTASAAKAAPAPARLGAVAFPGMAMPAFAAAAPLGAKAHSEDDWEEF